MPLLQAKLAESRAYKMERSWNPDGSKRAAKEAREVGKDNCLNLDVNVEMWIRIWLFE